MYLITSFYFTDAYVFCKYGLMVNRTHAHAMCIYLYILLLLLMIQLLSYSTLVTTIGCYRVNCLRLFLSNLI